MAIYKVTGRWVHEEVRTIEAKSKKEAMQKIADGSWDRVLDWNLVDFIDVDSAEKATPEEIKQWEWLDEIHKKKDQGAY